jgi:hypothetical protein
MSQGRLSLPTRAERSTFDIKGVRVDAAGSWYETRHRRRAPGHDLVRRAGVAALEFQSDESSYGNEIDLITR